MVDYEQCIATTKTLLKKKGVENHESMAVNMCSMWADDKGVERKFAHNNNIKSGETKRRFATVDAVDFPDNYDSEAETWEFPIRAITSGPHEYQEDGKDHKVYIEPNMLKEHIEAFKELPVYYTHQRTPEDLIGVAINPEIEEMKDGKLAVRMLAKVSDSSERAKEVIKKMKDGNITNVSIDWFSKDIDVMGDTFATNIKPVEVSFIDNEIATPVCGECTIDRECDLHTEKEFAAKEDCGCKGNEGACECKSHDGENNEVENMSKEDVKTDAQVITEREFASYKNQLDDLTTSHTELQQKYDEAIKAIEDFETANTARLEAESKKARESLVGSILEKELLVGTLQEDNKQTRFEELFEWEENKLSGFEEALANVPVPETERTFGKGKVQEEEATPREEPETERMFAMKDGKLKFNPQALKGD
jgi:hypothetical protein